MKNKMKASEKYFENMKATCMECGGGFSDDEVKRYGQYCNLEGSLEVGLSDVRQACREMLDKMSKEDKLK